VGKHIKIIQPQDFSVFYPIWSTYQASTVATMAYPGVYPIELEAAGIRRRETGRNRFLGTIWTSPAPGEIAIGAVYEDTADGRYDEDSFVLDFNRDCVLACYRASFEEKYVAYRPMHHADKSFLESK